MSKNKIFNISKDIYPYLLNITIISTYFSRSCKIVVMITKQTACQVLEVAMQKAEKENSTMVFPALDPGCYNMNLQGKMCNSGMSVMGLNNCFLFAFEAFSAGRSSYLVI